MHLESLGSSYPIYLNYYRGGPVYGRIYYDIGNTGYYVSPSGTSNFYLVQSASYFRSTTLGYGLMGIYDSTKYQGVFSMGSSYVLPADGSTTGNLYGLAWSHPNAGGAAANMDSHGLLCLINGGYASSMSYNLKASANVTAYSDERLKKNWRNLPNNFVELLSKVKYGIYDRIDQKITQVGVSAQSLEKFYQTK